MKQLLSIATLVLAISGSALAHGGYTHVRGVVTSVSADLITVELADKSVKTYRIDENTEFEAAGKPARRASIKVGNRVVIDLREHKSTALLIKIDAAAAKK